MSYRLQILHGRPYGLLNQMTKYKSIKSTKVHKREKCKKCKKAKNVKNLKSTKSTKIKNTWAPAISTKKQNRVKTQKTKKHK